MDKEIQQRLMNCRLYLMEAEKKPQENELYIDDLKTSINYFEKRLGAPTVMDGFDETVNQT